MLSCKHKKLLQNICIESKTIAGSLAGHLEDHLSFICFLYVHVLWLFTCMSFYMNIEIPFPCILHIYLHFPFHLPLIFKILLIKCIHAWLLGCPILLKILQNFLSQKYVIPFYEMFGFLSFQSLPAS